MSHDIDAIEELREATRQAHMAIKDLRLVVKEAEAAGEQVRQIIRDEIHARIDAEVARGLDEYRETLSSAIDAATVQVEKRFDTLADLLLGEDKRSRRMGKKSISDYVREAVE